MRVRVGTSGYQYPAWRGAFYPPKCKPIDMLSFYASRLSTVEINNTFYNAPDPGVLARWASQVPETFVFAIKAPQRITHLKRLKLDDDSAASFFERLDELGDKLGVVLFQLPPNFKCDLERLKTFLGAMPKQLKASFEFRHDSWVDAAVHDTLRDHGVALCNAEIEVGACKVIKTADFGYVRLRADTYDNRGLNLWARRIRAQDWQQSFVYFKHEHGAPALAEQLAKKLARTAA